MPRDLVWKVTWDSFRKYRLIDDGRRMEYFQNEEAARALQDGLKPSTTCTNVKLWKAEWKEIDA